MVHAHNHGLVAQLGYFRTLTKRVQRSQKERLALNQQAEGSNCHIRRESPSGPVYFLMRRSVDVYSFRLFSVQTQTQADFLKHP